MTDPGRSLPSVITATIRREILLSVRNPGDWLNPLMFFIIAVTLFPLGVGADKQILGEIAPGVIWVTALLAVLLSLESLFRTDFDDGSLEQLLMSPQPLYFLLLAKIFSHWLVSCLPIIILAPVLASMLQMQSEAILPLVYSLLLGTPVLTLLGAVGMALIVGLSRSGILLAVLILPLYVPVLVFGAGVVQAASSGSDYAALLAVLGAMLAAAVSLAPLAIAAALKISID